jgi:hypothetical protein
VLLRARKFVEFRIVYGTEVQILVVYSDQDLNKSINFLKLATLLRGRGTEVFAEGDYDCRSESFKCLL